MDLAMDSTTLYAGLVASAILLSAILIEGLRLMSAVQDLVSNVAALVAANASLQTTLTTVSAELASLKGDDPAVVQANTDIQAVSAALISANAALTPSAPAPVTTPEVNPDTVAPADSQPSA